MRRYAAVCIGGPLAGRRFAVDRDQFCALVVPKIGTLTAAVTGDQAAFLVPEVVEYRVSRWFLGTDVGMNRFVDVAIPVGTLDSDAFERLVTAYREQQRETVEDL